jgi:tripartite-type tricarboxylate transporter receptor subunit TctC
MTTRRQVLQTSGALFLSSLTDLAAFAEESYPAREVHVIAAYPPGSGADVFTRYFAENMRPFLGGTIVVENKVGASGNLALIYVSKAKPDGYTVLIHAPSAIAANLSLFKNPGYEASAFDVLGTVCRLPFTLSVSPNSPHKTLQSLIAAVRAKGANASYGTTAPTGQVAGAMMKNILNLPVVEVPYRTAADSVNDLDSGAVDYMMYDPIFAIPRHREGKVRVLAISSKERMTAMPDIPTMDESGVPQPIKDKISSAFLKMAEKPETKEWLSNLGGDVWVVGPAEAQAQMLKDVKNWADYVRVANMEPKG